MGIMEIFTFTIVDLVEAIGHAVDMVISNPWSSLLVGASFLGLGFRFLRRAKRVAR